MSQAVSPIIVTGIVTGIDATSQREAEQRAERVEKAAEVMHISRIEQGGRTKFLIGCHFTDRMPNPR